MLPHDLVTVNNWEFGHSHFNSQKSNGGRDHELMKGHDAMITAPKESSELLESIGNSG